LEKGGGLKKLEKLEVRGIEINLPPSPKTHEQPGGINSNPGKKSERSRWEGGGAGTGGSVTERQGAGLARRQSKKRVGNRGAGPEESLKSWGGGGTFQGEGGESPAIVLARLRLRG